MRGRPRRIRARRAARRAAVGAPPRVRRRRGGCLIPTVFVALAVFAALRLVL